MRASVAHAQPRHEALGIEGGVHLGVVVEVAVDVEGLPRADAPGPALEGPLRIAARVEDLVAVKAHVHEVGRDLLHERPLAGRVGDHERDAMLAQEAQEGRVAEALVADLDGVAKLPVRIDGKACTALQPVVAAAGQGESAFGVAWKELEEGLEPGGIEAEAGRELPQERAHLLAQVEDPGSEEVGERDLDVAQLLHVRDEAAALHREDEARRRIPMPRREAFGTLQRVVGAVDLDGREPGSCVLELAALRQPFGVEHAAPPFVAPARDPDPDHAYSSDPCTQRKDWMSIMSRGRRSRRFERTARAKSRTEA